jgi:hypothetical protein
LLPDAASIPRPLVATVPGVEELLSPPRLGHRNSTSSYRGCGNPTPSFVTSDFRLTSGGCSRPLWPTPPVLC